MGFKSFPPGTQTLNSALHFYPQLTFLPTAQCPTTLFELIMICPFELSDTSSLVFQSRWASQSPMLDGSAGRLVMNKLMFGLIACSMILRMLSVLAKHPMTIWLSASPILLPVLIYPRHGQLSSQLLQVRKQRVILCLLLLALVTCLLLTQFLQKLD